MVLWDVVGEAYLEGDLVLFGELLLRRPTC